MKRQILAAAFAFAALVMGTSAVQASVAPTKGTYKVTAAANTVPIIGTIGGVEVFNGTFEITRFISRNGELLASGLLTGTLNGLPVNQIVQIPVTDATGSCQILHLELGPIDLNLLGLMVHLDQVVLDITAQSGPGNLLGNLLCAVANLLNGGNPLTSLTQLLNRILGQL
jgi:hypothetical protein